MNPFDKYSASNGPPVHTLTKDRRPIETSRDLADSEQIEIIHDACLSKEFPTYLQDCNDTIITVLADPSLCVSELVGHSRVVRCALEVVDSGYAPMLNTCKQIEPIREFLN